MRFMFNLVVDDVETVLGRGCAVVLGDPRVEFAGGRDPAKDVALLASRGLVGAWAYPAMDGPSLEWLTNVHRSKVAEYVVALRAGHVGRRLVLGSPKATSVWSVEDLDRGGHVGIYDIAGEGPA